MKYKFLFILLFSFTSIFSQMESRMDSIKNEFIEDAFRYDVNMKPYLDKINQIKIIKLSDNILGNYSNGTIKINNQYSYNRELLKAVFYHEVGHLIGVDHMCEVCPYIMSAQNVLDYDEMTNEQWEYQLSVYFGMVQETINKQKNK